MHCQKQLQILKMVLFAVFMHSLDLTNGAVMITRPGGSNEDCERLCREEAEIECRFYQYNSAKSLCTLTSELDPTIPDLKKLGETETKTAESWVSQLQARILVLEQKVVDVKNLHREIAELRGEIEAMKNARALTHHLLRTNKEQSDRNIAAVDDKVEMARGDMKRMEDTILSLGDMQKTVSNRIRQLNEDSKATSLTVTMLSQMSKDTHSNLRETGASISEIKTSISDLKKSITDLQVRFAGLSTDVMEKVATVDAMVGPELKELKYSQTTLAQALALLTKKIMVISPRIPEIQKGLSAKEAKFSVVDMNLQNLGRQISFLTERMSFSEGQLKKLVDPSSRFNIQRRRTLSQIQSQVDSLTNTQTRLQNDLLADNSDRSRIYKELTFLKLKKKAIIQEMMMMHEEMRAFKRTLETIISKQPKDQLVSNILKRQLATLKSLKRMRYTQFEIQTDLTKYKTQVNIAQHEMFRQVEDQRSANQALRILQAQILTVFRKLSFRVEHDNTRDFVKKLIQEHNKAAHKINALQHEHNNVVQTLLQFKFVLLSSKKSLQKQKQQQDNSKVRVAGLEKRTVQLYKMLVLEKTRRNLFRKTAADQLQKLTKSQSETLRFLTLYRNEVRKTQAEMYEEKKQRLSEGWKLAELHQQLKKLNQSLAPLVKRGGTLNSFTGMIRQSVEKELDRRAKMEDIKEKHAALMNAAHAAVVEELNRQAKLRDMRDRQMMHTD
ncbi:unnamed protein product [Candidula unifasciata]|uniref:Apple domain-containing protein n=1 Tax=Candidula unifasciata TaxID=100452 RepID=A0A8S3YEF3_9EUPU|nr:unnamed protein product [Candidula unifasciata]